MPTFPLSELAQAVRGQLAQQSEVVIDHLTCSSKDVTPGSLFVAVRGSSHDGHAWLEDAFKKGAAAAVVEDGTALAGNPGIIVKDSRSALSRLAAYMTGEAARSLKLIGITGTNGKTTTNWLVCHALTMLGLNCARVGTLGMVCGDRSYDSLTTPDPITLHKFLAESKECGARAAVLEVSSHGLDQRRVDDVPFQVGVFTNLTRDHLDYHGTIERYREAKMRLFDLVRNSGHSRPTIVVNLDSEFGAGVRAEVAHTSLRDLSFGSLPGAPIRIVAFTEESECSHLSLEFEGRNYTVRTPMVGRHNAENLTSAFAACIGVECDPAAVAEVLGRVPQVPGRLERVGVGPLRVFVDYAHTPDALERAILAIRPSNSGLLWVVFGCGGDRDTGKRPQMAAIARRLADKMVVTSDNPRTEVPLAIIEDILSEGANVDLVEVDRRAAIQKTIWMAKAGDTVLIAGKGHEDYQIIGTEKIHFSDQQEALKYLDLKFKQDL